MPWRAISHCNNMSLQCTKIKLSKEFTDRTETVMPQSHAPARASTAPHTPDAPGPDSKPCLQGPEALTLNGKHRQALKRDQNHST